MRERSGGQIVAVTLQANGIGAAFCVPGESFLAVLDALYDGTTRLITCRHEAGAANMAVAYGKLTGRPGVCLVTRGPGATQASVETCVFDRSGYRYHGRVKALAEGAREGGLKF